MSMLHAVREIEAVDLEAEVDVQQLLDRVRHRIAGGSIADGAAESPLETGDVLGATARFSRSVGQALALLADQARVTHSGLDILQEWIGAETARNAQLHMEMQVRVDRLLSRINALAKKVNDSSQSSRRTEREIHDQLSAIQAVLRDDREALEERRQAQEQLILETCQLSTKISGIEQSLDGMNGRLSQFEEMMLRQAEEMRGEMHRAVADMEKRLTKDPRGETGSQRVKKSTGRTPPRGKS